jgi:selenocysteine lyase/cysteine desulfurase
VFCVRVEGFEPQALSDVLENEYGILTRSGMHCAPLAHKTIGTHGLGGTTRLSFGPFLTVQDVLYACDGLSHICQRHSAAGVMRSRS